VVRLNCGSTEIDAVDWSMCEYEPGENGVWGLYYARGE